ncbi:IS3 family transposase [Brevibacillus migulae]|uniref:IS3 family transposase n=1 Tax=Brevibacillus migulae TaxID=1644114 RepID=UPI001431C815
MEYHIRQIFLESRRLYGIPKITLALKQQNIHVSRKNGNSLDERTWFEITNRQEI